VRLRILLAVVLLGAGVYWGSRDKLPEAAPAPDPEFQALLHGESSEGPAGRWRPARGSAPADSALTPRQRAQLEELESVGYVGGVREAPTLSGVVRHIQDRVAPGLNFSTSGHAPVATLFDSSGQERHRWSYSFRDAWPDHPATARHTGTQYWRRARLLPDGGLIAIFEGLGILRLDRDSRLLWALDNRAHHDLFVHPDGRIVTLTRDARLLQRIHEEDPILEDFIVTLGPDGQEQSRLSLLEAFERSPFERYWFARKFAAGDLFHTNSVQVLDGRFAGSLPAFRAGNLLTSMRHLDAIAVVDPDSGRVVWAHRGGYRRQHDPRLLDTGRILLFNNDFLPRGSSVLELDPVSREIVWEYRGTADEPFFSETCGSAQRLPGGNTLITESDNGRAFEITPEGEIVWEYLNPERAGEQGEFIATLPEVVRIPTAQVASWLPDAGMPGDR
jgi:hypothetical protein